MVKKAYAPGGSAGGGQRRGRLTAKRHDPPVALRRQGERPAPDAGRSQRGQAEADLIALPVLSGLAQQISDAVREATGTAPEPGPGPTRDPIGDLARAVRRRWWELSPIAGTAAAVVGCHTVPGWTAGTLAVTAAGLGAWAAQGTPVRDRMWLSVRERWTAAAWAAWAGSGAGVAAVGVPAQQAAAAVVLGSVPLGVQWVWSRRVRRPDTQRGMSAAARQIFEAWPASFAVDGPADALHGSTVVPGTMREPGGAFVFVVALRGDVHSAAACTVEVRRALERAMRMPPGTARVTADPDDASLVCVELAPSRALERQSKTWPGPALIRRSGDLLLPLAGDEAGRDVEIVTATHTGVEHLLIVGASGAGKSNVAMVTMTPGPLDGIEVVVYLDGKKGQSGSRIAAAMDRVVVDPGQFGAAIEAVHAVMVARQVRYALMGQDQWDWSTSPDPMLTLAIEEAAVVNKHLTEKQQELVCAIALQGRSCGVRLAQVIHDPRGSDVVGGKVAREQCAANGAVIALRPGGSQTGRLALDSSSEEIDLTALPDAPGWAVVLRRGRVLSRRARVMQVVDVDDLERTIDLAHIRTLEGEDLVAASAAGWYPLAATGRDFAAVIRANRAAQVTGERAVTLNEWITAQGRALPPTRTRPAGSAAGDPGDSPAETAEDGERRLTASQQAAAEQAAATRTQILELLTPSGEEPVSMRRADLRDAIGVSASALGRALDRLSEEGQILSDGGRWRLTGPASEMVAGAASAEAAA